MKSWRTLPEIQSVVVGTAIVTPGYADGLRTAIIDSSNPPKWLQSVIKTKDIRVQQYSKGYYQCVIDKYMCFIYSVKLALDCSNLDVHRITSTGISISRIGLLMSVITTIVTLCSYQFSKAGIVVPLFPNPRN